MSKKYYYMKLPIDFFDSNEIKMIESFGSGDKYVVFFMKIALKSIKEGGYLRFNEKINYTPDMLSKVTNTPIDIVKGGVSLFKDLGLLEIDEKGLMFLPTISNQIGSTSDSAERMRRFREKKKLELESENKNEDNQLKQKKKQKKQKKQEKTEVKEENPKKTKDSKFSLAVKEIVAYLNFICGTKYKDTTPKTKSLIEARMKEGFQIQDFKDVVDVMFREWGNDSKMVKYLRPETLFSTKFEGYLNRNPKNKDKREVYSFPEDANIQPEKLDQDVLNFLKMNEFEFIKSFQEKTGKNLTQKERGFLSMAFYEIYDSYVYNGDTRPLEVVYKEVIGG